MTSTESTGTESQSVRVLGTLSATEDGGIVRLEARINSGSREVWLALTDPARLARWLGVVDGELRLGGVFRARHFASGWEGTCRVDVCDPGQRLLISTTSPGEPDGAMEVTLTADGDHTAVVLEDRGMPVAQIAAYGAGDQIHLEDLGAYLAGGGPCDAAARWQELHPAYQQLAGGLA